MIDAKTSCSDRKWSARCEGIDPRPGQYFDDTKRYIDSSDDDRDEDKRKVFELNARRVYPRLDAQLKARGL